MTTKPILFTHPDCSYSDVFRSELEEDNIDYEEVDMSKQPEKWDDLLKLTGGEKITPVFLEDGKVTIGYEGVG